MGRTFRLLLAIKFENIFLDIIIYPQELDPVQLAE